MALLDLVQTVCAEVGGISIPNAVASSQDQQVKQLLALATRAGKELASYPVKDSCWQALQKQYLFQTNFLTASTTSVAGSTTLTLASTTGISVGFGVTGNGLPVATTVLAVTPTTVTLDQAATISGTGTFTYSQIAYPLPADYDHTTPQTFWDRNYRWQMIGPLSPQEWQVLKSGIAPTGPRRRFRIEQNQFFVDPYPTDKTQLVFEYISNGWCKSASGVSQNKFQADTDVSVLPQDLLELSLKWRWLRAQGLDYDEDFNIYARAVERAAARDGGNRTLVLNRQALNSPLLSSAQIPDAGFGT